MVLTQQRVRLKNRLSATLAKYGLMMAGVNDVYGKTARLELQQLLQKLPPQTRWVSEMLLPDATAAV